MQLIIHEDTLPDTTSQEPEMVRKAKVGRLLRECVAFWNREGERIRQQNIDGVLGSPDTQLLAQRTLPKRWLLEMIASDCRIVTGDKPDWDSGRGGSHVWLHYQGERVMMFIAEVYE